MKSKLAGILCACLIVLTAVGCQRQNTADESVEHPDSFLPEEYQDIETVLVGSIQALEDKDVDKYVSYYHIEEIPELGYSYEEILEYLQTSAAEATAYLDLTYTIEGMDLLEVDQESALVSAFLTTTPTDESLAPTSGTSEVGLVKVDGVWYLSSRYLFENDFKNHTTLHKRIPLSCGTGRCAFLI